ncbi:hypothetical protein [Nocardia transvalensis]|uniref:hypothetical protein n=1 Tax=Nocardia transvalensis TaxID=37333 RepID=UPI001892D901|nr:hypothetical protein [Nocardia transvalensis]MBF6329066.1 hypothetical protein [Nocardia transvalensis]
MHLPRCWVGIDVVGTRLHGEIFVHSAGAQRVARPLRRVASRLGFDREGERLFTHIAERALAGGAVEGTCSESGIECRVHWIMAADDTPVGLILWVAPPPIAPRPVYNCGMLDVERVTTRTTGDGVGLIGDGRRPGEERPVRDLLRWMNPDDAPHFVSMYYDVLTGEEGTVAEAYWSVQPAGKDWIHFWTAAVLGPPGPDRRIVYALTVQLPHRDFDTRLGNLVRYTNATLVLVEASNKITVTSAGELAPLDEDRLAQVLAQIDIDGIAAAPSGAPVEHAITIDQDPFLAAAFPLSNVQKRPAPVVILLVPRPAG